MPVISTLEGNAFDFGQTVQTFLTQIFFVFNNNCELMT